jgi:hypothetical protein
VIGRASYVVLDGIRPPEGDRVPVDGERAGSVEPGNGVLFRQPGVAAEEHEPIVAGGELEVPHL